MAVRVDDAGQSQAAHMMFSRVLQLLMFPPKYTYSLYTYVHILLLFLITGSAAGPFIDRERYVEYYGSALKLGVYVIEYLDVG